MVHVRGPLARPGLVASIVALGVALASCNADLSSLVPAPEGLRAIERDRAVDLAWLEVDTPGLVGYRVYVAPAEAAEASFELVTEVASSTTAATVDGLTNFTAYRFVVRTVADRGMSDPSEPALGAPFSVASIPIEVFERDDEGDLAVLADGSRFRLHTREEMIATEGPEPPDFELGTVGRTSMTLGPVATHLPEQFTLAAFQTPIRSQGQRGTCQTFTAVAAMEAMYRRLGFGTLNLSEQFTSHLYRITRLRTPPPATAETRENTLGMRGGGSYAGVFDRLMTYRIPLEGLSPYVGERGFENPNQDGDVPRIDPSDETVLQSVYDDWNLQDVATTYQIPTTLNLTPFPRDALVEAEYGITGYSKVPLASRHDPAWYEQVLVDGHEIAFGFCFNDGGDDDDGVWRTGDDTSSCRGHAVLLIGYDRSDPDDPLFVAKNSWGGSAYQLLDYDFVTDPDSYLSAHVLGGVTDPGRGNVHPQIALGRWDLVYDGNLATLDVNRLSGFHSSSYLDGQQDRRLGALFSPAGTAYRVNGYVTVGSSATNVETDFYVDFADPALDYETLSGARFTGYVQGDEADFMAGTFGTPADSGPFGFYAHKDGPLPSVFLGSAGDPSAYQGLWRVLGLGGESHLAITNVLPSGAFSGITTHDGAPVSGRVDVANEEITFSMDDRLGIAGNVIAHVHAGDPGTASGTFMRGANPSGIALVRLAAVPDVEIDRVGTLREDGAVELGATATAFVDPAAVSIAWSYRIGAGGTDTPFATSGSGEVFTANLPCDDLLVRATARDASRGLEAQDVVPVSCVRASDTRLFHADRSVSGWINSNGKLGTAAAGDVLYVGDDALNHGYRSYLTFAWNLPDELADIEDARVTIFLEGVEGFPSRDLFTLRAYHVDYGDTLDLGDYLSATYLPSATVLPFDGTTSFGSITFDVTAAVQDAWANRATQGERLQLVLQFTNATDDDGSADRATFLAEDAPGTSLLPFVEITYGNY